MGGIWRCQGTPWVFCAGIPNRKENLERYYLHFVYCLCSSGGESACYAVSNVTTHSWGLRSVWPDSGSHSASHISVTCTALAAVPQSTPVPCAHANSIPNAVLHLQKSRRKEDFYPPQIQCRVRGSLRLLVWGVLLHG